MENRRSLFIKNLHYYSGCLMAIFIGFHLLNHWFAFGGLQQHIDFMHRLRRVYRNPVIESLLMLAVAVQIYSGIRLFARRRKKPADFYAKLQMYSGLYLAFFFIFHVSAVMYGRAVQHLDTNIYYGIAGLNTFPYLIFFVPYYFLAIVSFFSHIAAVHAQKMNRTIMGLRPRKQAVLMIIAGVFFALLILYTLTNDASGYDLPQAYRLKPIL